MNKYPQIYKMLKAAGHSPVKALEIVISAKRGECYCIQWIGNLFKCRKV